MINDLIFIVLEQEFSYEYLLEISPGN